MPLVSNNDADNMHLDNVRILCDQCGITSYPHTTCRCRLCGRKHSQRDRCPKRRALTSSRIGAAMSDVIPDVVDIGGMDDPCSYCGARRFRRERISCCANGAIQILPVPDIPSELSASILNPHVLFNIRAYNMCFAMASIGHTNKTLPGGAFLFGGKTIHRIGSMLPSDGNQHAFAQIYTLDVDQASDRRRQLFGGINSQLDRNVLAQLHNQLLRYNPCAKQFVAAAREGTPQLIWRCEDDIATMQIGALISEPGSHRDIIIQRANGIVRNIDDGHPLYHPLAYPLLFPLGQGGWNYGMRSLSVDQHRERVVTLTEWGRYHLMHRTIPTHLQQCQRLTLEFWCDVWAQVEARNAHFHKSPAQQAKYRAARVAAVEDQLSARVRPDDIGQPVVRLPSSFVGSARYYQQLYMDAMALPKKFGKPDIFLTMTCNPHWCEIRNAIPSGSHYRHHPDIVSRVFMMKLRELISDIVDKQIFGPVSAYIYRIEWQARGLPHAHCLFILRDKILSTRHIDAVISAELPDPAQDPHLHSLVSQHMLHPQCDVDDSLGCRRDNNNEVCACVRYYPKDMSMDTVICLDGYPRYRRRGRFTTTRRDGTIVTDNWVVPYNAYLLRRYQCHMNLEICAHLRSFKYIYKYTYKAPDHACIAIDEIEAHLSGRLLSVSEAVHRLLELPLHKEYPCVVRLDIHLPQQQQMIFDPTQDEDSLLQQLTTTTSTLMGWFALNAVDDFARTLLYADVPGHYIWADARWQQRVYKKTQPVGRIYGVSHSNVELYALRKLLGVVKGAVGFEDLATHHGVLYRTFREACMAHGMCDDNMEHIDAMREIIETTVSLATIRRQFARILVHGVPNDAQSLFNVFVDDLCSADDGNDAVDIALLSIENEMQNLGRSLSEADYGFVLPDTLPAQHFKRRHGDSAVTLEDAVRERDKLLPMFSDEQLEALHMIVNAVISGSDRNVFALISSAGCGKTIFANGLAAYLRAQKRKVTCVAASGLAAALLTGGTTAHSAFHIPIPVHESSSCHFSAQERADLKSVSIIIYDECSMVHAQVADTLNRTLQDIMHNSQPFGGKVILWMGDFKQLLPVVRYGRGQNFTLKSCSWWKEVQFLHFSRNYRALQHPEYVAFLEQVGHGHAEFVEFPVQCKVDTFEDMIQEVYGSHFEHKHQILALTLETCDVINAMCFQKFPGTLHTANAVDSYVDCGAPDDFPSEYVDTLAMKGAPPAKLQLKVGAKYMCIRNIDQRRGIVNGTMLTLIAIGRKVLQFRIMSGKNVKSIEIITRSVFTIAPEASGLPFTVIRRQFPVIPAYCLSVHKAQGQSITKLGIIFESDPFTHGQLYVALSRVSGWKSIVAYHQGHNVKNCVLRHLVV